MIAIIDYGAGNVCSLQFALERLGVKSELTSDPNLIGSSEKVIFPGQGSAGRAMEKLKKIISMVFSFTLKKVVNQVVKF